MCFQTRPNPSRKICKIPTLKKKIINKFFINQVPWEKLQNCEFFARYLPWAKLSIFEGMYLAYYSGRIWTRTDLDAKKKFLDFYQFFIFLLYIICKIV